MIARRLGTRLEARRELEDWIGAGHGRARYFEDNSDGGSWVVCTWRKGERFDERSVRTQLIGFGVSTRAIDQLVRDEGRFQ